MTKPPNDDAGMASAMDGMPVGTAPGSERGRQLDMWREPEEPDEAGARKRGPGRPAGSSNQSTKDWADWLNSRFRSPLIQASEVAEMHPVTLRKEWGFDKLETAAAFWLKCCEFVARYRHSPMPIALQIDAQNSVNINFSIGLPPDGAEPGRIATGSEGPELPRMVTIDMAATDADKDQQFQRVGRKLAAMLEPDTSEGTDK